MAGSLAILAILLAFIPAEGRLEGARPERKTVPPGTGKNTGGDRLPPDRSKGKIILTAGLELSENQISYLYSEKKNTTEMIRFIELILEKYKDQKCIYFSWDAAPWHTSKKLYEKVASINVSAHTHKSPEVKLVPLPSCAQFLNVIESVFSGLARAVIHNSNYQSVEELKGAIDLYFSERNLRFKQNPKRAGNKIWGSERVQPIFNESNNCKDPNLT